MSVTSIHERLGDRAVGRRPSRIVAVVLEDGTVRTMDGRPQQAEDDEWAAGQVTGADWVLWWERRSWSQP